MRAIIKVYADLICKKLRTIDTVPDGDREMVRQELLDRGREDLTADTE